MKKVLLSIPLLIGYFLLISIFLKMYYADIYYVKSEDEMSNGNNIEALRRINQAIAYNPSEPNYYKQRAKVYISSTLGSNLENQKTLKLLALNDAVTALSINPKNLATLRNTAPLYFFLANKDLSQPSHSENLDEEFLPIAQEYFLQMQNYTPKDVGVQILAAKYQKRLVLEKDYKNTYERIKSLRPDLLEWHPDLL